MLGFRAGHRRLELAQRLDLEAASAERGTPFLGGQRVDRVEALDVNGRRRRVGLRLRLRIDGHRRPGAGPGVQPEDAADLFHIHAIAREGLVYAPVDRRDERFDRFPLHRGGRHEAQPGPVDADRRKLGDVREEAVVDQVADHATRRLRPPERDEAHGRHGVRRDGETAGLEQRRALVDPRVQAGLQRADLVGQVDLRRGDPGTEHRRRDRPREDQWTAAVAHVAAVDGIVEHDHATARTEALRETRGEDHPRMEGHLRHHPPASARPMTTHAVRVVDVEMHLRVAIEHRDQRARGRQVAEHAVDTIGEIPDALPLGREGHHALFEALQIVVRKEFHRRARGRRLDASRAHARVHGAVEQHRVALADDNRDRGQVGQRGRRREDQRAFEDLAEERLQLVVQPHLDEVARRRERCAEATCRVDGRLDETRVPLEAEVAARTEVAQRPPLREEAVTCEVSVLGAQAAEPRAFARCDHLVEHRQGCVHEDLRGAASLLERSGRTGADDLGTRRRYRPS